MRKIFNLLAFPALALLLAATPNTASAQVGNPGGQGNPIGRLCQFIVANQDEFGDGFRSFETVGDCARAVATLGPVLCKKAMEGDPSLAEIRFPEFSNLGECVSFIQQAVRNQSSCDGLGFGLIFFLPTANSRAVAAPDKSVCRAAPRSATRSAA